MPPGDGPRPKKLGLRGSEPLLHSVYEVDGGVATLGCEPRVRN